MAEGEFAPVTPGEMLKEEYWPSYGLSQAQLAKAIGISSNRIAEIVNNQHQVTADTAPALTFTSATARSFGRVYRPATT